MLKMKKIFAMVLALVMVFALSCTAFAANGDLTVVSIDDSITFTNEDISVTNPLTQVTYPAYSTYAQLPDNTNFSNVHVNITYTGTSLKVNGTTVDNDGTPFNGYIDFTAAPVIIEVVYSGGSRPYYAAAYPSTFSATVVVDYENARAFSELYGNTYYNNHALSYMNRATWTQIGNAEDAVDSIDAILPTVASRTATYASTAAGTTAIGILNTFGTAKSLTIGGSSSYVSSIDDLDMDSTGTYTYYGYTSGSGGWMYKVTRGATTMCPLISGGSFKLMPGDVVTWIYTCDLGYDIGAPML